MSKLGEVLELKIHEGLQFGVEIEIEGNNLPEKLPAMWKIDSDNSLRGIWPTSCAEYVLRSPMPVQGVDKALTSLSAALKDSTVNMSFRCSTHVHVNMSDRTHREICNFLTTYYTLEPLFDRFVEKHRRGNRFCARLQDAEGIVRTLSSMFSSSFTGWYAYVADNMRYAALNVASLRTYGSVELRTLEGTVDKAKILSWINLITTVYNYSIAKESPQVIHEESFDAKSFVEKLFPGMSVDQDLIQEINLNRCLMIQPVFSYVHRDVPPKKSVKFQEEKQDIANFNEIVEQVLAVQRRAAPALGRAVAARPRV